MDTSDVLLAARDVLRERGWVRGMSRDRDGRRCLFGATTAASPQDDAAWHLDHYCREHYGGLGAAYVNDHVLTSEDEACDLLEAAAKWDGPA